MTTTVKVRPRALVRASGGPRYAVALGVDALGTGMLRPFLLLYGLTVLRLSAPVTGVAMTVAVVTGLVCMPAVGRWIDRGARSTVVAASMLVRVAGVAVLLATPEGSVWMFAAATLLHGVGNQAWPAAHAAVVATVAQGRERDAALAAGRTLRNAGLGVGALVATVCLAGGAPALRALAAATGLAYLVAAALAWSVRLRVRPVTGPEPDGGHGAVPRMPALLAANVVYVFCLNVPEIALPLVLVTQLHAAPAWSAAVFVANTVLVVALQVPVTLLLARYRRRSVLALAGLLLSLSYLGFLLVTAPGDGHPWAAPAVLAVSVLCTVGEIVHAGSATALVTHLAPERHLGRALARFELSTGLGLAVSPAVITALAPRGPLALWGGLAAATLLAAAAVAGERDAVPRSADGASADRGTAGASQQDGPADRAPARPVLSSGDRAAAMSDPLRKVG
ncbi:MFS transporter [Streptomyces sp. CO7]